MGTAAPHVLADGGSFPGPAEVPRASHPLPIAPAATVGQHQPRFVPGGPVPQLVHQVPGDRHYPTPPLLRALSELSSHPHALGAQVDVVPGQGHGLLHPQPREPQQHRQIALPTPQLIDAGVHLGPGRRHRRRRGLADHADLARRRDRGARLVVVVQPGPGQLHHLHQLAAGGVLARAPVQTVVFQRRVPIGQQAPSEQGRRQRSAGAVDLLEVADEEIEGARVADGGVGPQHPGAFTRVVLQQASEIRLLTNVTRLPSDSERAARFDLRLEFEGCPAGRTLPGPGSTVRIAPAHAPPAVPSLDARHSCTSIHQRSMS